MEVKGFGECNNTNAISHEIQWQRPKPSMEKEPAAEEAAASEWKMEAQGAAIIWTGASLGVRKIDKSKWVNTTTRTIDLARQCNYRMEINGYLRGTTPTLLHPAPSLSHSGCSLRHCPLTELCLFFRKPRRLHSRG